MTFCRVLLTEDSHCNYSVVLNVRDVTWAPVALSVGYRRMLAPQISPVHLSATVLPVGSPRNDRNRPCCFPRTSSRDRVRGTVGPYGRRNRPCYRRLPGLVPARRGPSNRNSLSYCRTYTAGSPRFSGHQSPIDRARSSSILDSVRPCRLLTRRFLRRLPRSHRGGVRDQLQTCGHHSHLIRRSLPSPSKTSSIFQLVAWNAG